MARVYLSLGSNIRREHYISSCLDGLAHRFGELDISSVYESEAVGFDGDPFFNLVVGLETELALDPLFEFLRETEHAHDRCRKAAKFSARTLDIDILTYDDYVGPFAGGELPREEITRNAFVLWPLAEIAADLRHPGLGIRYGQLWANYDKSRQALWPVSFVWQGRELLRYTA
ncbi:2-amino-4-hydroxy-6-hydroxymethyldihydropteridine diphosphokinase [Motiliproteus sediminis]|uniref:2-amino-4-hydroxy-6- hydroxymethyldihydropteridine diphosphokinase n=1 Tax=Motiliproteus sediminis TaxID=1468178 RepID=UPI001AEFF0BC|nr:2-amino-4-hydroxy-6-hydroxymethyldihydropteridine diphosphokinase [Motiliproteus sediminis]